MEFFELIKSRQSIRNFTEQTVDQEKIDNILKAIQLAPSAGNLQALKVFLLQDKDKIKKLSDFAIQGQDYSDVPLIMVFCAWPEESEKKYGKRGESLYSLIDATIACAHAQLAAHAQGLATVWVGAFEEEVVSLTLELDNGLRPIAILPIGYAYEKAREHKHKKIDDIVTTV